jgi:hypothetical protein|tara:strand:+ start:2238 stop:3530 length:1293 start_codon:yes stop_codon:yes gene_type:complete
MKNIELQKLFVPDKEFRKYLTDKDIGTEDGEYILSKKIQLVEELQFLTSNYHEENEENYNFKIKDFTGIEAFKNLKSITYTHCELSKINLNKNELIEKISINNLNTDTFNLKGLVKLKEVTIYNSKIKSLDFQYNNDLSAIKIHDTYIDILNICNTRIHEGYIEIDDGWYQDTMMRQSIKKIIGNTVPEDIHYNYDLLLADFNVENVEFKFIRAYQLNCYKYKLDSNFEWTEVEEFNHILMRNQEKDEYLLIEDFPPNNSITLDLAHLSDTEVYPEDFNDLISSFRQISFSDALKLSHKNEGYISMTNKSNRFQPELNSDDEKLKITNMLENGAINKIEYEYLMYDYDFRGHTNMTKIQHDTKLEEDEIEETPTLGRGLASILAEIDAGATEILKKTTIAEEILKSNTKLENGELSKEEFESIKKDLILN